MKTIFKKTLVAAALTAAAFNASAVTLSTVLAAKQVSLEGNNTQDVVLGDVQAVLGAEYTVQDTVSFSLNTGEWDTTATPTLTAGDLDAGESVTIGFVGYSDDKKSVTFRITAQSAGIVYAGDKFTLSGAKVKGTVATASVGDIKVSYSAKNSTGSINIDNTGTTQVTAAAVVREFTAVTYSTKADAVIDVNDGRKTFESAATTDTVVIDLGRGTVDTEAAAYTGLTATLVAAQDWKFLDKDKDGTVETSELNGTDAGVTAAGATIASRTLSADNKTITIEFTPAAADTVADVTLTLKVPGNQTITNQAYTSTVTYKYNTSDSTPVAKTSATSNLDAGQWTLNGSNVQVPYIVFGNVGGKDYNTILQVNNASSTSGDIFADVWKEDGTVVFTNKKVGTAAANSTTNVAPGVATELATASASNGKFSVRLVSNTPAAKTTVYSAFVDKTTTERVIVNNDSPVQTK